MSQLTFYICGPMTGQPEFNYPAFMEMEARLAAWQGRGEVRIINPARNFGGETGLAWPVYMRLAVKQVAEATDLVRLPGWEHSRGARLEVRIAEALDITIWDAVDFAVKGH